MDAELLAIAAELDELGGGDTRVAHATVIARVRPAHSSRPPLVEAAGDHVLLR